MLVNKKKGDGFISWVLQNEEEVCLLVPLNNNLARINYNFLEANIYFIVETSSNTHLKF